MVILNFVNRQRNFIKSKVRGYIILDLILVSCIILYITWGMYILATALIGKVLPML